MQRFKIKSTARDCKMQECTKRYSILATTEEDARVMAYMAHNASLGFFVEVMGGLDVAVAIRNTEVWTNY